MRSRETARQSARSTPRQRSDRDFQSRRLRRRPSKCGYMRSMNAYDLDTPWGVRPCLTLLTTIISVRDSYAVCDAGMRIDDERVWAAFFEGWVTQGRPPVRRTWVSHGRGCRHAEARRQGGDHPQPRRYHPEPARYLPAVQRGEVVDEWPSLVVRKFK